MDTYLSHAGLSCSPSFAFLTLQEMVIRHRNRMRLPAQYIGMHVRRGHKWVETSAQPLEDYISAAHDLARNAGTRHVLVATEGEGLGFRVQGLEFRHVLVDVLVATEGEHSAPCPTLEFESKTAYRFV